MKFRGLYFDNVEDVFSCAVSEGLPGVYGQADSGVGVGGFAVGLRASAPGLCIGHDGGGEELMSLGIGCGIFRREPVAGATGSAQNHPILSVENV